MVTIKLTPRVEMIGRGAEGVTASQEFAAINRNPSRVKGMTAERDRSSPSISFWRNTAANSLQTKTANNATIKSPIMYPYFPTRYVNTKSSFHPPRS